MIPCMLAGPLGLPAVFAALDRRLIAEIPSGQKQTTTPALRGWQASGVGKWTGSKFTRQKKKRIAKTLMLSVGRRLDFNTLRSLAIQRSLDKYEDE